MEIARNDSDPHLRPGTLGNSRAVMERDLAKVPEELLSVLLHDLRSPLGAIGVLADVIANANEAGNPPEPRQLILLQEAVTKAQRIMDDAVEIQSVLRGSSVFCPALIEMETVVRNSLEKATHAPYFRNVDVDYNPNGGDQLIKVDVEKAETAVLCALEQSVANSEKPLKIRLYHSVQGPFGTVHITNEYPRTAAEAATGESRTSIGMRGRLGTRRLGESRYNLLICAQVLHLMGGRLEHTAGAAGRLMNLQFPVAQK